MAVLSDKQTGLVPAVATALPDSRHQFCQAHYLRNLAEPLAAADAAFKVSCAKPCASTWVPYSGRKPGSHLTTRVS